MGKKGTERRGDNFIPRLAERILVRDFLFESNREPAVFKRKGKKRKNQRRGYFDLFFLFFFFSYWLFSDLFPFFASSSFWADFLIDEVNSPLAIRRSLWELSKEKTGAVCHKRTRCYFFVGFLTAFDFLIRVKSMKKNGREIDGNGFSMWRSITFLLPLSYSYL